MSPAAATCGLQLQSKLLRQALFASTAKACLDQPCVPSWRLIMQVFNAYCNKKGVDTASVRFLFDGNRAKPDSTPEALG